MSHDESSLPSARHPVTTFTEDEEMIQDTVRQWAQQELKPIVRDMDDEGSLRPKVLQDLFDCGFMGMVSDGNPDSGRDTLRE